MSELLSEGQRKPLTNQNYCSSIAACTAPPFRFLPSPPRRFRLPAAGFLLFLAQPPQPAQAMPARVYPQGGGRRRAFVPRKIKKGDFNSHLPALGFVECPRFFRGLPPTASRTSLYSLFSYLYPPNCLTRHFGCSSICFQISNPLRQSSIINLQQPPRLSARFRILPSKNPPRVVVVPPSTAGTTAAWFNLPPRIVPQEQIQMIKNPAGIIVPPAFRKQFPPFHSSICNPQLSIRNYAIRNHQSAIINHNRQSSLPPFVPPFVSQKRIARPAP